MGFDRPAAAAVAQSVFQNYSVVFLLLVASAALGLSPYLSGRVGWFGLAWVGVATIHFGLSGREGRPIAPPGTLILTALTLLFAAALVIRFLPQAHTEIPIGYDYGFYKAAMDAYETASPDVPETSLPPWIRLQFEPGLLILHQALHEVAGLDAYTHLRTLFPILSAFLVVPLYAATRAFFGPAAGLIAAAFYTASFAQYTVHEYLYEKNVLGLALFLALLTGIRRRSWIAAGILLGAIGITHRPTLLLAAATLAILATYRLLRFKEWKGWLATAAIGLALFLPIWLLRRDEYFGLGIRTVRAAGDNVGAAIPEGGGTFLSFLQYQNAAAVYLPLALVGAVFALRRSTLPALAFLLAFANVALKFVFYNRFIIMLDLIALIFVAVAIFRSVPPSRRWLQPTVAVLLVLLAAIPTFQEATRPPGHPYLWINDDQREAVLWMRTGLPAHATVLASNLDSPYVIADSGRRTYGPGLFDDPHNATAWRTFFVSKGDAFIEDFLSVYGPELYLFHADGHGPGLGTGKFEAPQFELVYDARGARIWRFQS